MARNPNQVERIIATLRAAKDYASFAQHPDKDLLVRLSNCIIAEADSAWRLDYHSYVIEGIADVAARACRPVGYGNNAEESTDWLHAGSYTECLLAEAALALRSYSPERATRILNTFAAETARRYHVKECA